jgi:hypothetical protein
MDQFIDYADRGRRFADAVRELTGGSHGESAAPGADASDDAPPDGIPPAG